MSDKIKTRLFVDAPLHVGAELWLPEGQAHYLLHTLRTHAGEQVGVFNGREGEWSAAVTQLKKRDIQVTVKAQRAPQKNAPDLWLAFAPVKNEKIDYMVKRAVELGVSALLPVITRHTIVSRVNMERLRANAVEAAEQCGRMDIPHLTEPQPLDKLLGGWPSSRMLIHCDEGGTGKPVRALLPTLKRGPAGVLTGPEGGFAAEERTMILSRPYTAALSLGPRILRAETAALAALANVQAWLGDWDEMPHFEAQEA